MARIHIKDPRLAPQTLRDRSVTGATQLGLAWSLTPEEKQEIIRNLDTMLIMRAMGVTGWGSTKQLASEPGQLIVRDLLPKNDIGITNQEWEFTTHSTANTAKSLGVSTPMPDDEYWGFYGYGDLTSTPNIYEIKFMSGAVTKELWNVQILRNMRDDKIGFAMSPIIYAPSQPIAIYLTSSSAGATTYPVFLGRVCELRGVVLNG